jgi:hypothetical protein
MAKLIHRVVITVYSSTDFGDTDGKPGDLDENTLEVLLPDPDSLLMRAIHAEQLAQIRAEMLKNPNQGFFW